MVHPKGTFRTTLVVLSVASLSGCGSATDSGPSRESGGRDGTREGIDAPVSSANADERSDLDGGATTASPPPKVEPGATELIAAFSRASDPILTIGHGLIIPRGGAGAVTPTVEIARAALKYYLERLHQEAGSEVRSAFDKYRSSIQSQGESALQRDARLFAWLIERVHPKDAARLESIHGVLRRAIDKAQQKGNIGVKTLALHLDTPATHDYMQRCVDAGVPKPPPWGRSGKDGWQSRGELRGEFVKPKQYTEVFTFQDAKGICFALPRGYGTTKSEGIVDLLGIICQGNQTSKACFWDGNDLEWQPAKEVSIEQGFRAANGPIEVCTDCHRGENAFLIHPDTPLDLKDAALRPKGWTTFLANESRFFMNRKPAPISSWNAANADGSCLTCHDKSQGRRFGEISSTYCESVVLPSIKNAQAAVATVPDFLQTQPTMPPNSWKRPPGLVDDLHASFVKELCEKAVEASAVDRPLATTFDDPRDATVVIGANERVAIGYFQRDGRADLVRVDATGKLTFAALSDRSVELGSWSGNLGENIRELLAADINGDGADDLVAVSSRGVEISFALAFQRDFMEPRLVPGTAPSDPSATTTSPSNAQFEHVLVADFDNNRQDDLMLFASSGKVSLFLSNGYTFAAERTVTSSYVPGKHVPLAGDVDGDTFADLVLIPVVEPGQEPQAPTLAIGELLAPGSFREVTLPFRLAADGTSLLRLADVSGDGLGDLMVMDARGVTARRFSSRDETGALWPDDQGGAFLAETSWSSEPLGAEVWFKDVNADGRDDLVSLRGDGTLRVALAR